MLLLSHGVHRGTAFVFSFLSVVYMWLLLNRGSVSFSGPLRTQRTRVAPDSPRTKQTAPQALTPLPDLGRLTWSWQDVNGTILPRLLEPNASELTISHSSALSGLRDRSILFIADSITRYQYLNLVYFLATGSFHSPKPHNENEKHWGDSQFQNWTRFYIGTTERLQLESLGRGAICDCFRELNLTHMVENRYYRDARRNISVSFVFLGRYPIHGHDLDWLTGNCTSPPCRQTGCPVGSCSRQKADWDWVLNTPREALVHLTKMLRPDTIIYNSGAWGDYGFPKHRYLVTSLIEGGHEARMLGVRHLYWKTTTDCAGKLKNAEMNNLVPRLRKESWRIYDSYTLTHSLALMGPHTRGDRNFTVCWDRMHPYQGVHMALNEVLLRQLIGR
jgi:hypothetical protein